MPNSQQYNTDPEVRFAKQIKTLDTFIVRWRELMVAHPDANEKALLAQAIFDGAQKLGEALVLCDIQQNVRPALASGVSQVSDLCKIANELHGRNEKQDGVIRALRSEIDELRVELGQLRGNKGR
jgi:hypothetical protein